jgi:hypothetical protein
MSAARLVATDEHRTLTQTREVNRLVGELIEAAARQSAAWWQLAERLEAKARRRAELRPHVWAFAYLVTYPNTRRRELFGPLGPRDNFESGPTYPPRIEAVPEEVEAAWAALSEMASHPLTVSRYNELTYLRTGDPTRAGRALAAYLALVGDPTAYASAALAAAVVRAAELAVGLDARRVATAQEVIRRVVPASELVAAAIESTRAIFEVERIPPEASGTSFE